jgi:hypothetical protein
MDGKARVVNMNGNSLDNNLLTIPEPSPIKVKTQVERKRSASLDESRLENETQFSDRNDYQLRKDFTICILSY